jgi:catechol 2,3-dioxygenase-like lactoylglutathione lyase family enzyme
MRAWRRVQTCMLVCLAITTRAAAQPRASSDSAIMRVSPTFFALSVANLDSSTRWYREKLGLTVTMHAPRTDATRAGVTVLEGGGLTVELVKNDDAKSLSSVMSSASGAISIHGIFKVGVVVEDFDRTIAALEARGVEIAYGPYPRRGSQAANAIIRGNAGNLIQVIGK